MRTLEKPYSLIQSRQNSWWFKTDNNVEYVVKFESANHYFLGLPPFLRVFEMSIEVINNIQNPPLDLRIEKTIIEAVHQLFEDNTNSLLYICESLDGRHFARARKFNDWFIRQNDGSLEKYDEKVIVVGDSEEILAYMPVSLILHTPNPYKQQILEVFNAQIDEYNK